MNVFVYWFKSVILICKLIILVFTSQHGCVSRPGQPGDEKERVSDSGWSSQTFVHNWSETVSEAKKHFLLMSSVWVLTSFFKKSRDWRRNVSGSEGPETGDNQRLHRFLCLKTLTLSFMKARCCRWTLTKKVCRHGRTQLNTSWRQALSDISRNKFTQDLKEQSLRRSVIRLRPLPPGPQGSGFVSPHWTGLESGLFTNNSMNRREGQHQQGKDKQLRQLMTCLMSCTTLLIISTNPWKTGNFKSWQQKLRDK